MPEQNEQQPNPPIQSQAAPDYAGYPSVDALVEGYRNSSNEAKRILQENQALKAALANPAPPQQQQVSPYDQLSQWGLPVDALQAAIDDRINRQFQPIARGLSARSQVLAANPDYNKFEADVAQYINADPAMQQSYNALFNADPAGAMEYAFLKYGEQKRRSESQNGNAPRSPKTETTHAQIPTKGQGETRGNRDQGQSGAVSDAYEHYRKTGDPSPYIKARLRSGGIKHSAFDEAG